jgi:NADH:ubiquinone oxidoreductase subunit 5 (subunit L)/multisubunit Na+/H+ antiporter MnhA subunit
MFYIDELYHIILVRPLRAVSRWALVAGIEQRLLDRVVVTGGSGLVRRFVWTGLRRIQNGRLQSYALLGLLTVLVVVTWMVS